MITSARFVATYRLELTSDFDFGDAGNIVEYLRDLGISHLSLSPFLHQEHSKGFDQLMKILALQRPQMGAIIDAVVPAALPSTQDPAFADVLKAGPHSPHLAELDIEIPERRFAPLITLPILRSKPATALSAGEFCLSFDSNLGFYMRYHEYRIPLAHISIARIIHRFLDAIASSPYFAKKELEELSLCVQTLEREQVRRYPRFRSPIDQIYQWFAKSQLRIGQLREFLHSAPMLFVSDILRHQHFALETPSSGLAELFLKYHTLHGLRLENSQSNSCYSHITPNVFVADNESQGPLRLNAARNPQPDKTENAACESMARTAAAICAPGVPYFCSEVHSKVDFEEQHELLEELGRHAEGNRTDFLTWLKTSSSMLSIQLWVIRELLQLRREHYDLFEKGEYIPLRSDGVAFARRYQHKWVIVATDDRVLLPSGAPTQFWNYLEQKPVAAQKRTLTLQRNENDLPSILLSA